LILEQSSRPSYRQHLLESWLFRQDDAPTTTTTQLVRLSIRAKLETRDVDRLLIQLVPTCPNLEILNLEGNHIDSLCFSNYFSPVTNSHGGHGRLERLYLGSNPIAFEYNCDRTDDLERLLKKCPRLVGVGRKWGHPSVYNNYGGTPYTHSPFLFLEWCNDGRLQPWIDRNLNGRYLSSSIPVLVCGGGGDDDEYHNAAVPLGLWPLSLEAVNRRLPTMSRQANVLFHLLQGPAGVLNSMVQAKIVE
jgi:hypothetical protein